MTRPATDPGIDAFIEREDALGTGLSQARIDNFTIAARDYLTAAVEEVEERIRELNSWLARGDEDLIGEVTVSPGETDEDDDADEDGDYSTFTNEQLRGILRDRDLPVSGDKGELVQRLIDDDNAFEGE